MEKQKGAKPRSTADPAHVQLTLFGKVAACIDGREIAFSTRKARALLGYLALSDAAEETRERLIGLLWSETEEERARASLRQALYEMRVALEAAGLDVLSATKVAVSLDRARTEVDAWAVLAEAKEGRAHPLLLETERLADTLLGEFETIDSAFRVWLLAKRQTLHDRLVRYLEQAMREDRAYAAKADLARAILNLDPTHEEAARWLMRLRGESGDIGGALSIYKRLWDLLADEYDVEPSKETQELIAAMRMAQPEAPTISGLQEPASSQVVHSVGSSGGAEQSQAPARLVIAVAPFDLANVGEDRSYLVQGFRRELIARLVRFREWSVRDGVPLDRATQAHEYLLEASALQGAHDARLIVVLRDMRTNEYVWSDEFKLALESWIDSQQALVRRLAIALNVYLSAGRISAMDHRVDRRIKIHDRFLLAQSKAYSWTPGGFHEAVDALESIIKDAPDFSPAYSVLAQLQNAVHFVHPGVFRETARTAQALEYARQSTHLDPVDSRGQLALGWAHAMANQHDLAGMHHGLAQDLNDNDPWTATSVALGLAMRGELADARKVADRALELGLGFGPQHWGYHLQVRFMAGDYEGSLQAAEPAGNVIPTSPAWKIAALGHLGRIEEAKAELDKFYENVSAKWFGATGASRPSIARWTLHSFPFKRHEDWEHFRDGLAAAGMPVSGLVHGTW